MKHIVAFLDRWGVKWRPSSDFTSIEIAFAQADGKMYVDPDGLGWIRDMTPLSENPEWTGKRPPNT